MKFFLKHKIIIILLSIITFATLYYKSYGFSLNIYSLLFIVIYLIMLILYIKYERGAGSKVLYFIILISFFVIRLLF